MVNIKKDVDEVWLGFDQAMSALGRDGHKANENITACQSCYAMYLLENAMRVYRERGKINAELK